MLAQQLADQVHAAIADDLDRQAVLEVIERAAPRRHARRVLLAPLAQPHAWTGRVPVLVARLVNALAEAGAARSLPVLACHDCDKPTGTPAFLTRDRIRCGRRVRRCPRCGREARHPARGSVTAAGRTTTDGAEPALTAPVSTWSWTTRATAGPVGNAPAAAAPCAMAAGG